MGILLFLVAIISTFLVGSLSLVFSIVYYLVTLKWKTGSKIINAWFYKLALSVDQLGNVLCSAPFNLILIKSYGSMRFGDEDDTISYVLAINNRKDTLTGVGRFFGNLLNLLDNDHLNKAIENKKLRDLEAVERVKNNSY